MSLEDRLRGDVSGAGSARLTERIQPDDEAATVASERPGGSVDPYAELKSRIQGIVIPRLGTQIFRSPDPAGVREQVRAAVTDELSRESTPLSQADRDRLVREISADILGYGPLEPYLADDTVTEVMVNGFDRIFIERDGRIEATRAAFSDEAHLYRIIDKIVSQVGRRVDEASPMVDARLPDGSRVNAVVPPLSLDGPSLTIRKFSRDPFGIDDLVLFGSLTTKASQFLQSCVDGKLNVLISGGTGTGKTTLLNALSAFISADERVITIEDAAELQLQQPHVVRLESRPPNIEGEGEIKIRDLVRNALRMRPDRIIVGEVRSAETLDMLQAMNTGHEGSLTTIHANSPRDALGRLETLVLMSGLDLPLRAIREQISSALDVVVHITRLVDGSRRISHITEVVGMESEMITLQDVFAARAPSAQSGGSLLEPLQATGLHPHFGHKLAANGVFLPGEFYEPDERLFATNGANGNVNGKGNSSGRTWQR